jgi:hypothetical protein
MLLVACCTSGKRIRLNEHQWAPDEVMRRSKQEHANLVDHPAPFAVELRNDRKKLSTFFGSTFSQLNRNGNDRNIIGYLGTIKFGQE